MVYAALGEKDKAFEQFERGVQEHAPGFIYSKVDPFLDNLRADQRNAALLQRSGL